MEWDRLKGSFNALVGATMSHVDFHAFYPCKVLVQNSDSTLELKPEDTRLPGFSKVPIRYTVPGMKITIASKDISGVRCLVGFDGGNPKSPFAAHFYGAAHTYLDLGNGPVDFAVKGTSYRAWEKSLHQNMATALNTIAASLTAAGGSLNTAGVDPTLVAAFPAAATALVTSGASVVAAATATIAMATTITSAETAAAGLNNYLSSTLRNT